MGAEPIFIIAEAGINHDGSLDKALRLIDIAAASGADAVKFQTFKTDEVVSKDAPKAAYQERQTGTGSQYEMIRRLELDERDHERLAAHCRERSIEFMSTPFAPWAVDLLVGLGMRRIKVASGEIVNLPLLRKVAGTGLPIILSTGMATMDEVVRAVGWINRTWDEVGKSREFGDLIVLHCTSDYPTPPEFVNLAAMNSMGEILGLPIGYSDHSEGITVAIAAAARGARVIEKHFTENRNDFGPDHAASLEPEDLKKLVEAVRLTERALGSTLKAPAENEMATRVLVRRSAVTQRDLTIGDVIGDSDIAFLRPGSGIGPERADELIGRRVSRSVKKGTLLAMEDLET